MIFFIKPKKICKMGKNYENSVKGKPRSKLILKASDSTTNIIVSVAESEENSFANSKLISREINKHQGKPLIFSDLHCTFSYVIDFAKKSSENLEKVKDMIQKKCLIIISFVGWDNDTTRQAINDIHYSIASLGVVAGIIVSERNRRGTTPESQIFVGGKGWMINNIMSEVSLTKSHDSFLFLDDHSDHILSVDTMNEGNRTKQISCLKNMLDVLR